MEKKEEGMLIPTVNETKEKESPEPKKFSQEQVKRMRKEAAMELADYKRRLRESVELKKLQVEEIELNIQFYHASKEYEVIQKKIAEEEAKHKAEMQKQEEDSKKKKLIVPAENKIIVP